jgi:hydrogenase/urease accessory protein HupE
VAFIAADQSTLQVIVIVSITLAWPLVTIILGHVALARGKARGESQSNKSLAMAGVILAYICVACWVLIFTYLLYLSVTGTHLRM